MRAAGLKVGYLDEHMGVGWLPGLRDAFVRLAAEEGLIIIERVPFVRLANLLGASLKDRLLQGLVETDWQANRTRIFITHPEVASVHGEPTPRPDRVGDLEVILDPALTSSLADVGVHVISLSDAFAPS